MSNNQAYLKAAHRFTSIHARPAYEHRQMNSEETLLERAQKLDEQSLAQLHDRYYPLVYRYVRYRLDDEQIVEDISSEVFLRLLDHLHKRKSEIRDLRGWLLGTAGNIVSDHLRQKYRRRNESLHHHEELPGTDDPQRAAENREARRSIRLAMQSLTREQQHVLALRFSQELSIEETARIMNKTAGAVKVLQFRALASLRRLIGIQENK